LRSPAAAALTAILERVAPPPRNALAVLTYHRVDEPDSRPWLNPSLLSATPAAFEAQMAGLLRRHRPVGLAQVLAAQRGGASLPERAVLVTFDDAYRDFLDHAWPVLVRYGIPATLFVPTAYPDGDRAFWWDRVWQLVRTAPDGPMETPAGRLELSDEASRRAAARALVEHHKGLAHTKAMASIDRLVSPAVATSPAPATGTDEPDVLGWDEIRELAAAGLQVALHSRTHALLTQLDNHEMEQELTGSRGDLESRLGTLAFGTTFAYPAGRHSPETRAALARLGFELAFTTDRGINRVGTSDPLQLRRLNVGMRAGPELVRAQMAFFTLRYRSRGV